MLNGLKQVALRAMWLTIVACLFYLALTTLIFLVSLSALRFGVIVNIPWIIHAQSFVYTHSLWTVWQNQSECVEYDPDLIYVPKIGTCKFRNLEFDTTLQFDSLGRRMDRYPDNRVDGIAVVGDSFAMGWGVEDNETFSAVLQAELDRPVYNLAVSSYATTRQLTRLEKAGVLDRVDTVIIQYCDNDLPENISAASLKPSENHTAFNTITQSEEDESQILSFLLDGLGYTSKVLPNNARVQLMWKHSPRNFDLHYDALMKIIDAFPSLAGKQVYIFYSLSWGAKFRNYPIGVEPDRRNVHFLELDVASSDHFPLDGHLNVQGHEAVGKQLADILSIRET